jgi:hypothetical protein
MDAMPKLLSVAVKDHPTLPNRRRLIHEAPAIAGRETPSPLAHAASE